MGKPIEKVAEIEISYRPANSRKSIITSSLDAYNELIDFFPEETISLHEKFVVMYLNRANRVLGVYELSKGGITSTSVDLRLLLSVALKTVSTGIILCHNHPSGNLKPSANDLEITNRIKEACGLMDIKLLDHLIVAADRHYNSLAEENLV